MRRRRGEYSFIFMLDIGLQPEYILHIGDLMITNTFFTSVLVSVILILFSVLFYIRRRKKEEGYVTKILKVVVYELLKLTDTVTRDRELSKKILPVVATFFIFIGSANVLALIPGFLGSFFVKTPEGKMSLLSSPNSDLTITLALAVFSVLSTQYFSIKQLGLKNYLKRFFNFSGPLKFIVGFFEMLSESIKLISFSFRLFGNIFAGEVLLLVVAFLFPYILPLPFMILEIFVGLIQAFIFAMLTLSFIKSASSEKFTKNKNK